MPISALDSLLFKNLFGTSSIRSIFDDKSYIDYCVLVEAALARAEALHDVIPASAAEHITQTCQTISLDYDRLSAETEVVGYPILPLVRQLAAQCGEGEDEAGRYVHWGATTQDIQDTASMLQIRAGLDLVETHLVALCKTLGKLAEKYRDTPMAGRTHLQHALPVTWGYKCAVYLSSFQRHLERMRELRPRCLMVQFGGAAGTLASLGEGAEGKGVAVRKALAEELGLGDPGITWHTARDGVAEILNFLALVGGSLGKVAMDIMVMSSNEFGEVSEPFVMHRGASSTMPQKRNPISSEVVLAASKILRANAGLCLDAMATDFERATGPWHLEWVAVPESFVVAVGALSQMDFAMSGLVLNAEAMGKNLASTRGLIVAERVMMELAGGMGRQKAHDVVYEACRETIESEEEEERTLCERLCGREEVVEVLTRERVEELCEPRNYLGQSREMVDVVLKISERMGIV
ncbi:3-carboxy-cis,cis-muconate cycloisomerase like protein [Zymoseptoria brevis]|uniref:3-carboxy-cis,cis-muconate cycloisomerase like protein n=1 Tax=Zymoseptoria brevis TaxID=1047168 RepID=A0A0F4G5L4_9PEZI|nr:3-carboxy-cis,cis-muconate cycloisomerase like protein [Zymoseptoria brevis]